MLEKCRSSLPRSNSRFEKLFETPQLSSKPAPGRRCFEIAFRACPGGAEYLKWPLELAPEQQNVRKVLLKPRPEPQNAREVLLEPAPEPHNARK